MTTRSEVPADLAAARADLIADRTLSAPVLRARLADLEEKWLTDAARRLGIADRDDVALLALGGLARREVQPYSDLDLVLLHGGTGTRGTAAHGIAELAESLWYPLWDSGIRLDHSVRTVEEAISVARTNTPAALGLLEGRRLAGSRTLADSVIQGARTRWRAGIRDRLGDLISETEARWERSGMIAQSTDPDLKNGRGGLRDLQLLVALAAAHLADGLPAPHPEAPGIGLAGAHILLLDTRTELHRAAGRCVDVLRPQYADEVAGALGLGDRFDLASRLSDACRTVDFAVAQALHTARNSVASSRGSLFRRRPVRRPLAAGAVEYDGEVVLARAARPARDAGLPLRVASAAARTGLPVGAATLRGLADSTARLPEPWPRDVLEDLLVLLGAGTTSGPIIEALDRSGLWGRMFPEWDAVRDLQPRDPAHVHTVDRHLVRTAEEASAVATRTRRPDLLFLAALLHDLGKGRGGDHSEVGENLARTICTRIGLREEDVDVVAAAVRHHLLLAVTASRRDVTDPAVAGVVLETLGDRAADVLDILEPLTEADSRATGPRVWNEWRGRLIAGLAATCRAVAGVEAFPEARPDDAPRGDRTPRNDPGVVGRVPVRGLVRDPVRGATDRGGADPAFAASPDPATVIVASTPGEVAGTGVVTVTTADRLGVLSAAVGVLSMHGLDVWEATIAGRDGLAVDRFVVATALGGTPAAALLRQDMVRVLAGDLDPSERISRRAAARRRPPGPPAPAVATGEYLGAGEAIVEVRAQDEPGLLYRLSRYLDDVEADVTRARVETRGAVVVDVFALAGVEEHDLPGLVRGLRAVAE